MRMGSFIVGGMVGAALAIYMKRNNQTMMQTLSNIGQFVNTLTNQELGGQQASQSMTGESAFSFDSFESDEESSANHMQ